MNKRPSYKEQFDKITEAYIKGEIKPYKSNFCFCGTIAPEEYSADGHKNWNNHDGKFMQHKHFYTLSEYGKMEEALFIPLHAFNGKISGMNIYRLEEGDEGYEDAMFDGMCAALEVLKQIHVHKGDIADEYPVFKKR